MQVVISVPETMTQWPVNVVVFSTTSVSVL